MVGAIIYFTWLFLLPIGIVTLAVLRVPRSLIALVGAVLGVVSLPAYYMLLIYLPGWAWPPDIFMPGAETRITTQLPGYHVDFVQQWGSDYYETSFEITRADGKRATASIDSDDNKCWHLSTQQVGARLYFLCDAQAIDERTSYIDHDQLVVYSGWYEHAYRLAELDFK